MPSVYDLEAQSYLLPPHENMQRYWNRNARGPRHVMGNLARDIISGYAIGTLGSALFGKAKKKRKGFSAPANEQASGRPRGSGDVTGDRISKSLTSKMARKYAGTKIIARGNKRVTKYKKRNSKKKKKTLKSRVYALEKFKALFAVREFAARDYSQLTWVSNECVYRNQGMFFESQKQAALTALTTVNDAGASIALDLTTQANLRNIYFKNVYCSVRVRNNYDIPMNVTFYWMVCIDNTDRTVTDIMTNSETELGYTAGTALTDIDAFPSSFPTVKKFYKCIRSEKALLNGGDTFISNWAKRSEKYNVALSSSIDIGEDAVLKGDITCLIRCHGVIGHVSGTPTSIGRTDGRLDLEYIRKFQVMYPNAVAFRNIAHTTSGAAGVNSVWGPNVVQL